MKSLKEYIENYPTITLADFINNSSYDFDEISEELSERCNSYRHLDFFASYICEGSGVAPECKNIAISLSNAIKELFKRTINITKPYKCNIPIESISNFDFYKFVNALDIEVKKSIKFYKDFKGDAFYDSKEGDEQWDNTENKFIVGNLTINLAQDYFEHEDSCADLLSHELNHIAQDWYRHQKEGKSVRLDKQSQEQYLKMKDLPYKSIIKNYIKKEECNSYIAQIEGEIKDKTFNNYNDAIDWLDKNSFVWKEYKALRKFCEESDNKNLQHLFHKNCSKFINHLFHLLTKYVKHNYKISEKASKDVLTNFINIPEIIL